MLNQTDAVQGCDDDEPSISSEFGSIRWKTKSEKRAETLKGQGNYCVQTGPVQRFSVTSVMSGNAVTSLIGINPRLNLLLCVMAIVRRTDDDGHLHVPNYYGFGTLIQVDMPKLSLRDKLGQHSYVIDAHPVEHSRNFPPVWPF